MAKNRVRYRSLLISLPLAGAALAYVFLFFLPRREAMAELKREITSKQDYISEAPKLKTSIGEAQQSLATANAYNQAEAARCVPAADVTKLFGKINQLAKQSGVRTTRFEPQAAVQYQSISKVPVSVTVEGRFASIQALLYGIENLGATVWVDDLKLATGKEDRKGVECSWMLGIFVDNPEKSD